MFIHLTLNSYNVLLWLLVHSRAHWKWARLIFNVAYQAGYNGIADQAGYNEKKNISKNQTWEQ